MKKKVKDNYQTSRRRTLIRRRLAALTAGTILVPLAAYSLTLTDYLNTADVTPSGDQFEQVTTNNTSQVQITPNAELIIVKVVENDDGGLATISDFTITTDATTDPLNFTSNTVGTTTTYTSDTLYLAPDTYSLVESDVDGYTEGSWSCDVGTLNDNNFDSGEVVLAIGEQATCTIINDDQAPTLTLTKVLINDNGGNLDVDDFEMSINDTIVLDGDPNIVAANVDLTIDELDIASYAEGTWSCVDDTTATTVTNTLPTAGLATGTTFQLLPGSVVDCTITNNDLGIDLAIVKSVDDNTPNIGQIITFTMDVTNAGPDDATDVTITDIVPAGFTYAGTISGGDSSTDTNPDTTGLTWTIDNLPAGTPAVSLSFTATVNAP